MIRFSPLCTVTFYHRYFGLNPVDGFKLVPDSGTVKTLTSYGILLKEISGTFYLLSKEDQTKPAMDKRLTDALPLRFLLYYNDPYVFNYTDLELEEGEGFLVENKPGTDSGEIYLHQGEYLNKNDIVRFVQRSEDLSSFYKYDSEIVVENKLTSEKIFSGSFDSFLQSFSAEELFEIGRIQITTEEVSTEYFFVERMNNSCIGIVQLRIDQTACLKTSLKFSAKLNSRSAVWRYNLINREDFSVSDFKIFSGKNQITVQEENVVLVNGEEAHAVTTSEPLLLQNRYENLFELEYSKSGSVTSKKRITLPVPDVSKVKVFRTQEGRRSWCDMYIYL